MVELMKDVIDDTILTTPGMSFFYTSMYKKFKLTRKKNKFSQHKSMTFFLNKNFSNFLSSTLYLNYKPIKNN